MTTWQNQSLNVEVYILQVKNKQGEGNEARTSVTLLVSLYRHLIILQDHASRFCRTAGNQRGGKGQVVGQESYRVKSPY